MKRVLNSGSIRLPQVKGTEEGLRANLNNNWTPELFAENVYSVWPEELDKILFSFEIKAPLLIYLALQDVNLGTLSRLEDQDRQVAYLPAFYYTKDCSTFSQMDAKTCNVNNTKLFNFYTAAFNFYNNLLEDGMCVEQAQLILPQGIFINFLWEVTAKDLFKFVAEHYNDSPEMYGYCSTFVLYLEENLPLVTKWVRANKWVSHSL
jgi:hypothetical protein